MFHRRFFLSPYNIHTPRRHKNVNVHHSLLFLLVLSLGSKFNISEEKDLFRPLKLWNCLHITTILVAISLQFIIRNTIIACYKLAYGFVTHINRSPSVNIRNSDLTLFRKFIAITFFILAILRAKTDLFPTSSVLLLSTV